MTDDQYQGGLPRACSRPASLRSRAADVYVHHLCRLCRGDPPVEPRGRAALRTPRRGAVGHTLDPIVPEPYRTAHWAGFSRAVQQGRFAKDDVLLTSRALTKDGSIIAVELAAAIIRNSSGQVWGIMAIGRDVTARRAREQAQHERIASLERKVAALTEGIARAGEGGNEPSGRGMEPRP